MDLRIVETHFSVTQRHIPKDPNLCENTGLLKMIVGFLFNGTTLQVFVTYLTVGALYVHPL